MSNISFSLPSGSSAKYTIVNHGGVIFVGSVEVGDVRIHSTQPQLIKGMSAVRALPPPPAYNSPSPHSTYTPRNYGSIRVERASSYEAEHECNQDALGGIITLLFMIGFIAGVEHFCT